MLLAPKLAVGLMTTANRRQPNEKKRLRNAMSAIRSVADVDLRFDAVLAA